MLVHRHCWAYGDPLGRTDSADPTCTPIGTGVCIRESHDADGRLVAFVVSHERSGPVDPISEGWRCEGRVPVGAGEGPRWRASGSLEGGDLTLHPSILCVGRDCGGSHGYVRDGRWVPV